ncbi:MAG: LysM peptidoglycan-binding domain-containing protein [Clostridia bacterium]|nr:LysM peptidoglycan-binding domain-containing protein [Clostridia bacterium]
MIKFLGKNKIYNETILHQFSANETLFDVAKKYNISLEVLKHNKTQNIYAGQCIAISGLNKKYHLVRPTETIKSIAKLYNTTPLDILKKNNVQQIFIGQLLEI